MRIKYFTQEAAQFRLDALNIITFPNTYGAISKEYIYYYLSLVPSYERFFSKEELCRKEAEKDYYKFVDNLSITDKDFKIGTEIIYANIFLYDLALLKSELETIVNNLNSNISKMQIGPKLLHIGAVSEDLATHNKEPNAATKTILNDLVENNDYTIICWDDNLKGNVIIS